MILETSDRRDDAALVFLLRVGAVMTSSAFLAVLLPVEWMTATHQWLGLGALPQAPIVDYLARSVAALYGFHGVLLFIISTDVARYRALVWFAAGMSAAFGVMLIAIGLHAGLPGFWVAVEGPSVIVIGLVLALLNRGSRGKPALAGSSPAPASPRRS